MPTKSRRYWIYYPKHGFNFEVHDAEFAYLLWTNMPESDTMTLVHYEEFNIKSFQSPGGCTYEHFLET